MLLDAAHFAHPSLWNEVCCLGRGVGLIPTVLSSTGHQPCSLPTECRRVAVGYGNSASVLLVGLYAHVDGRSC